MKPFVLMWGGGDLASGAAIRLKRAGISVLVIETAKPLAVRRSVAFAQAVYDGQVQIEDVSGCLVNTPDEIEQVWRDDAVPVIIDPALRKIDRFNPLVLVDARMQKTQKALSLDLAELIIGLGPGFKAGENCHAAVETNRGHNLGRVYWEGSTQPDTGIPGNVKGFKNERVFHAPTSGLVETHLEIGTAVKTGDRILSINGLVLTAPFPGIVRGLIQNGLMVEKGVKVGDVDPRPEPYRCWLVSDKSLAIGGGVLEATLTHKNIRQRLYQA